MNFWEWYDRAQQEAHSSLVPPHELDWLIGQVTGIDTLALRLQSDQFTHLDWQPLSFLWYLRLTDRVPVQYLAGRVSWGNLQLEVSPAVLIPRPETELLIEIIESRVEPHGVWCDLGTGSGAIAIELALTFSQLQVLAVDISAEALDIADRNIRKYALETRVKGVKGRWFAPLTAPLDGMVSNPPYIPTFDLSTLQPEVRDHEPWLALDGGKDGLSDLRELVRDAPHYLRSGGFWICEVMVGQAQEVGELLFANGFYRDIMIHSDLSGIDRFVSAMVR